MSKRIDEMDLWALSAIFVSRPGAVVQGRASVSRKAAFCATFSKKVAENYISFILFFLERKEPKENRRCANRSLLPA